MTTIATALRRTTAPLTHVRSTLVVLLAALVMVVNNGFIFVGLTVFDPLILDRLGASVGALKIRDAVTLITAAVLSPVSGYLLDRIGVRPIMAAGMIFMAIGMYFYADATSLQEIYLIHAVFGCCLVMSGLFVCIVLITGVTSRHRGLAVGIVLAGSSLGQAISPKINILLESQFGWQNALRAGAFFAVLLVPVILAVLPTRRLNGAPARESTMPRAGLTYAAAFRTRSFWLLSTIAMVTFFAQLGLVTNLVLYVEKQLGQTAALASQAAFVVSTASVVFKLCAGPLIDRLGAKPVHFASVLLMGMGFCALAIYPRYLLPCVACIGIGWGGNYAAIQVATSRLFAGHAIGRILGTINIIEATGAALGPPGFGRLYDMTHTYAVPFGISAAVVLLMSLAVVSLAGTKNVR